MAENNLKDFENRIINNDNKQKLDINLIVPEQSAQNEISLFDVLKEIKRSRHAILRMISIFLIIGVLINAVYLMFFIEITTKSQTMISYNFDGISSGKAPNGKNFDVNEIKSASVLHNALTELNLYNKGITTEDVRKNIKIDGQIPKDTIERILTIQAIAVDKPDALKEILDVEYFPTQYIITLNIDKSLKKVESQSKELLDTIIKCYKDYFLETYGDRAVLSTAIGDMNFDTYDYPDIIDILKSQITIMKSYLNSKVEIDPNFRANETQLTFSDIIAKLDILESVDLARINSVLINNSITRDPTQLRQLYEYKILNYNNSRDAKLKESELAKEMAEQYKQSQAILTTGADGLPISLQQSSEAYDKLVKQSSDASIQASNYQVQIDYYKILIERLDESSANQVTQDLIQYVEDAISTTVNEINKWVELTNITVDEYIETEMFGDAIKTIVPSSTQGLLGQYNKTVFLIMVACAFTGAVITITPAFFRAGRNSK